MKKRRGITLVVLMVLSQLTLTIFVGWWIVHQYHNEKAELKKELWRKFAETEKQVTDSIIFKNFVVPLTQMSECDSNQKRLLVRQVITTDRYENTDTVRRSHDITLEVNDTGIRPGIRFTAPGKQISKMMAGIRMMIQQESDSGQLLLNYPWDTTLDSTLFLRLFKEKTDDMGLGVVWVHGKTQGGGEGKNIMLYSGEFGDIPAADIQGYNRYLLGRLWPQLVFGLLLVLLTATSFIIAYRSIRSQQKLNMLREDFISNISHELKTPLSTAKVTIEALKTFDTPKRAAVMQEYLGIAEAELDRLDELVTKVLHTGMLEHEGGFVCARPAELTALVNETVAAFKARTKEKNVQVTVEPHAPVQLNFDTLHVQGVLYNLLDNAVKYHEGSDPLITVRIQENGRFAELSVSDNGPGINAEYQDKVFDKFFRIPSGNVHNVKGHGLGLSYTRQVMRKHGGEVSVYNNTTGGCTFVLHFPKSA